MKSLFKALIAAACVAFLLAGCVFAAGSAWADDASRAGSRSGAHGIAVENMDRSVLPGDNFYLYANGAWIARTVLPPDRSSLGVWSRLSDLADKRTAALIQEAAKTKAGVASDAPNGARGSDAVKATSGPDAAKAASGPDAAKSVRGSDARRIADLYNSFMNAAAIEAEGLKPLQARLDAIRAISSKRELARALGESLRADVDALNNTNFHTANLFGLWVAPGFNDSDHYAAYLMQGGLELPDREYYLSDSEQMRDTRNKYQAHVTVMLRLAGFTDPEVRATSIVELEHAIAEKHISLEENEDIQKANNTWKRSEFAAKAPGLDWAEYFRAAGLDKQEEFTVWQPTAFVGESALVASTPLATWKDWLAFHLIQDHARVLPKAFADESFNFFGKTLSGAQEQRPRWVRGVRLVNYLLADAVGKIYAQKYFPPEAKAQAQEMVANIVAAFRKRIEALPWMAPETKAEAQAKLSALYVGIGYPENWIDYSDYEVKAGDLFGNVWRGELFEYHRQVKRLGANVDRHEWCMSPQTVNAVNMPLHVSLNFPAAILQPPFFDPKAPAATNYGAIGSVIGHEISHTFDSEGAAFDAKGRVRNWWTADDLAHFNAATASLAAQYDTYKPFPDLHVNGKQTLGEDIADVAGIAAAYDAYHAALAGKPAPVQDGFTGDQQFFIAFGQNWGDKTRDAALRTQVMTDGHAPDQYRAATVRNIDAWYPAFNVKPGEKLFLAPAERVRIW